MKPTGPHPRDRLKAVQLWKLPDGRHADGGGLYLLVDGGSRRWLLRTTILGRRRDMGLGSLRDVPLAEARELARQARRAAKARRDPIMERRRVEGVPVFAEAADKVWRARSAEFRSEKHSRQWLSALKTFAYPVLAQKRVDSIGSDDILRVVEPIWATKRTTAAKVLQRIKAILDWSIVQKHRDPPNPADIVTKALSKSRPKVEHYPALPYDRMADFIRDLRSSDAGSEMARLAVEFCILTGLRIGTVRKAERTEVTGDLWVIPDPNMKVENFHNVPLPPRCVEILNRAHEMAPESKYLFAGERGGRISATAVENAWKAVVAAGDYRDIRGQRVVLHGFRSALADWADETTSFSKGVVDVALSHAKDHVDAAYFRGQLLEKRRKLMQAWSKHAARPAKAGRT